MNMQRLSTIGKRILSRLAIPSALVLLASLPVPAMAQDVYQLLVKMKNNEEKAFVLAEKPVVTFNDTECVIDCNGYTGYFDMSEVLDLTIVKNYSGISEAVESPVTLEFTDPDTAIVRGVPSGINVSLYTLDGILLYSTRADSDGNAVVDMSSVAPGSVCIISVNSVKNFKLYRK